MAKYRTLSEDELREMYHFLTTLTTLQDLKRHHISSAATKFGLTTKSIWRWVRRWQSWAVTNPKFYLEGNLSRRKKSGRPRKHNCNDIMEKISKLPPRNRQTLPQLANALDIPYSTLHNLMKENNWRKHNVHNKVILSHKHQTQRCVHCLSEVEGQYSTR